MHTIHHFMAQNPVEVLFIWTFVLGAMSTYAQTLDSPTKDSSQSYKQWFAFVQYSVGQFKRANAKLEDSPNFQDAVKKYLEQQAAAKPEKP